MTTTNVRVDVPELVEAGLTLKEAIRAVLARQDMTMASWCRATGFKQTYLTRLLSRKPDHNGRPHLYSDLRDALCRAFGLDREWLDEQLAVD